MLKRLVVQILGRERANRIAAPYHDWKARKRTQRTLRALPQKDLLINIGCGPNPLPGWVNLDSARSNEIDVVWDLRRGLPFPNESATAIFGEHVIEHVPRPDAEALLGECRRVLQTGGVLRLSTPDAGRFLRSYAGDQKFLADERFVDPADTPMDRVNMMMREHGQHLWAYDAESLVRLLRDIGFSSAEEREFGVSAHQSMQGIDAAEREFESLYVEAVK
ncbi:MAG TPA: methyltransferase domain-containing protein [Pyrinomonadaceae bacterium]|nr:methyltransferase domain-containing protein [Pyrinomonadaceae bacterium]